MKVLLQNIRSAHNVGSIFRTADAVGVTEIFLGGYTPSPYDRYGDANKSFVKVSLGAEEVVGFSRVWNLGKFFEQKKAEGYRFVALEITPEAIDYSKFKLTKQEFMKTILVLGNERRGISKTVLSYCDKTIKIPMSGMKESLNVSVAFGIAAFALRDN